LAVDWSRVALRGGVVAAAWLLSWVVTGWPMAGVIGGAVAMTVPMLVSAREARATALAKTAALASWAEMLRDTMSGHAGLNQAIAVTADVAPEPVRHQVRRLAVRAERQSLSTALRTFAAEVSDPVADLIVAALVIADERQARDLTKLLSEIASSARQQAAMRMRVETGRARTYAQSQALVAITLLLVIVLLLFSPEFLEPYDTFGGQLVLAIIGALFAAALLGLVQLGRPADTPRLLGGIEGGAPA
jgi:Flp pilus assembly protein TadB